MAVDEYRDSRRRIRESITQPAAARGKQKPTVVELRHCIYCAAPTLGVVCAGHLDLLGQLEAER